MKNRRKKIGTNVKSEMIRMMMMMSNLQRAYCICMARNDKTVSILINWILWFAVLHHKIWATLEYIVYFVIKSVYGSFTNKLLYCIRNWHMWCVCAIVITIVWRCLAVRMIRSKVLFHFICSITTSFHW